MTITANLMPRDDTWRNMLIWGDNKVLVKVVDIYGNDTTKMVEVEI